MHKFIKDIAIPVATLCAGTGVLVGGISAAVWIEYQHDAREDAIIAQLVAFGVPVGNAICAVRGCGE